MKIFKKNKNPVNIVLKYLEPGSGSETLIKTEKIVKTPKF